jgi:hypothetical protein
MVQEVWLIHLEGKFMYFPGVLAHYRRTPVSMILTKKNVDLPQVLANDTLDRTCTATMPIIGIGTNIKIHIIRGW